MAAFLVGVALSIFLVAFSSPVPEPDESLNLTIASPEGISREHVTVTPYEALKRKNLVSQRYDFSCGSAAFTTILNYYLGEELQETDVMNGMLQYGEAEKIIERRGFSLFDMKRFAAHLGYRSAGFRAEYSDLEGLEHPAIVPIRYGGFDHFVVLRSIVAGHVAIADPQFGNFTMTETQFQAVWDPQVLFIIYPRYGDDRDHGLALSDRDLQFIADEEVRWTALRDSPEFWSASGAAAERTAGLR
ncbi:MAG: C39 family peptidase [Pseudomonadota bacterium]|nr:C39 family peptidase [Pseudomonadota bacterium]